MTISPGTEIVTPLDNPCQFDPDWRAAVAIAIHEGCRIPRDYREYKKDIWIRRQVRYLDGRKFHGRKDLKLAEAWYRGERASDVRNRLEPLLLTAVDIETIALDIGGGAVPLDAFKAYERIYFNIRDDKGMLNGSCQLRSHFAFRGEETELAKLPPAQRQVATWKLVGALLGYDTLVGMWLWGDAHGLHDRSQEHMLSEMWRVAQSRLLMNVFADRVGHESLAKLLGTITAQTKMLHEDMSSGQTGLDMAKTLMALLYKSRPVVLSSAKSVDELPDMTAAIKARLNAQRAISSSANQLVDAGAEVGEAALTEQIKERIRA